MADPVPRAIQTRRLLLRPMQPADAEPLFALFADWEVIRWLSMPPWPYTLDDAHTFIAGQIDGDVARTTFAIVHEGALIGGIDVRMNKAGHSQRGPGPNLGYWLGQPYWGHGYVTEAAFGFIPHVFAAIGGDVMYSGAFTGNAGSLRVQEKLGFVPDGECMLFARPRQATFPHINTVLARSKFEAAPAPGSCLTETLPAPGT